MFLRKQTCATVTDLLEKLAPFYTQRYNEFIANTCFGVPDSRLKTHQQLPVMSAKHHSRSCVLSLQFFSSMGRSRLCLCSGLCLGQTSV